MKCLICKSERVCPHVFALRILIVVLFGLLMASLVYIFSDRAKSIEPAPLPLESEAPLMWGEPVQVTRDIEVNSVQFLPDGRLLFAAGDEVLTINTDGTDMRNLFSYEGIRRSNMSPDGEKIVFDDDFDIFTVNSDGTKLTPVANDPDIFEFAISFTPDGNSITFVTIDDVNTVYGIWIMDIDGSNKRNLYSSSDVAFRHPRQSPEGTRISYFTVGEGIKPAIWTMDVDGTNTVALTNPKMDGVSRQASWSADSEQFVYSSKKAGDFDIWIMNTDGDGKARITSIPGDEAKPVFSPDGDTIAFVCSECFGTIGSDLYVIPKE